MKTPIEVYKEETKQAAEKLLKSLGNIDQEMTNNIEIISSLVERFGNEQQALAACLMVQFNLLKTLAELCEKFDKERWDKIMKDPVIAFTAKASLHFRANSPFQKFK